MITINENDMREKHILNFTIVCNKCESSDVLIIVDGAEEHGEVGEITIWCRKCGNTGTTLTIT